jgi:hypothetical protein
MISRVRARPAAHRQGYGGSPDEGQLRVRSGVAKPKAAEIGFGVRLGGRADDFPLEWTSLRKPSSANILRKLPSTRRYLEAIPHRSASSSERSDFPTKGPPQVQKRLPYEGGAYGVYFLLESERDALQAEVVLDARRLPSRIRANFPRRRKGGGGVFPGDVVGRHSPLVLVHEVGEALSPCLVHRLTPNALDLRDGAARLVQNGEIGDDAPRQPLNDPRMPPEHLLRPPVELPARTPRGGTRRLARQVALEQAGDERHKQASIRAG